MIVIKLGGSLYSSLYLKEWVDGLASIDKQIIIIVPGGGPFADQVRQAYHNWEIDEEMAHEMGVLSMQQYASLIFSINKNISRIDSISSLCSNNKSNIMVWFPYKDVMELCSYPKSWDVTSDSISLWLANEIGAKKLCLVKSAEIDGLSPNQIINSNIVDEYFPNIIDNFNGKTFFYNANAIKKFISDIACGKF